MKLINILKQHYILTEHVACHTLQSDKMYRSVGLIFFGWFQSQLHKFTHAPSLSHSVSVCVSFRRHCSRCTITMVMHCFIGVGVLVRFGFGRWSTFLVREFQWECSVICNELSLSLVASPLYLTRSVSLSLSLIINLITIFAQRCIENASFLPRYILHYKRRRSMMKERERDELFVCYVNFHNQTRKNTETIHIKEEEKKLHDGTSKWDLHIIQ